METDERTRSELLAELGDLRARLVKAEEDLRAHRIRNADGDAGLPERNRSEKHAERFNRLNELILNSAAEGILGLDVQGNHTFVNPAAARMLGYETEELIGRFSHSIWHHTKPDGSPYPSEECQIYRAFLDGVVHRVSTEVFWRKDGQCFSVEYTSTPILEQGRPVGTVVVFTDITERLREEESQARLATAVEQSAETIMITDLNGTILYANPAFEKATGYTCKEALGQNPRMLKSDKQDPESYRRMWALLAAGKIWRGHFINKRKDGTQFEEDATISPVRNAAGKIVSYVAVKRDVTHEIQLEAQFRQAQKMEAIGLLAGGVAHDFNNLLTVINGRSQLMLARLKPEDPTRHEFELIFQSGARAAGLTRQLLAFSRKLVLEPKVLNLNILVFDMQKILHRLVRENVLIKAILEPNLKEIKADPGQLEQVLMNLVVNARDAMPQGGFLTIETKNVELDERYVASHPESRPGSHVLLSVSDTGCGMDAKTLARIFEPFFTTKEVGQGTGLGLSTVFGIVKQSGGSLSVYSEVGKGSTFKIYLPAAEGSTPAKTSQAVLSAVSMGHEVILLVEDEEAVRELAREILQMSGYTVLTAGNGMDALRVCEAHQGALHLLISDVVMPKMGGPDLSKQLLRLYPNIKVLFVSGYTDQAIIHSGVLEASVHFLQKPFTPSSLARKVRELLDQR